MSRITVKDVKEMEELLMEFDSKKNNLFKIKVIRDKVKLPNNQDQKKIEFQVDVIYELLLNKDFRSTLKKLKKSDLSFIAKTYSNCVNLQDKNQVTKSEANIWGDSLIKLLTKLEAYLTDSPNISRTNNIMFYVKESYALNFIEKLIDNNVVSYIDEEMGEIRFRELKYYIENSYDGDETLIEFLEFLKEKDYISKTSRFSGGREKRFVSKIIFNKITLDLLTSFDKKYFMFLRENCIRLVDDIKTIRQDKYKKRTIFIKRMYNYDGKADMNLDNRIYDVEIIAKLITILFKDLEALNLNAARAKVKKTLNIN